MHSIEDNEFKRMPHQLYSSHVGPMDFCHFVMMNQRLQTYEGGSFEELQENVHEILDSIGPDDMEGAMRVWMGRLRKVTDLGARECRNLASILLSGLQRCNGS
jgi:hypothetical protein